MNLWHINDQVCGVNIDQRIISCHNLAETEPGQLTRILADLFCYCSWTYKYCFSAVQVDDGGNATMTLRLRRLRHYIIKYPLDWIILQLFIVYVRHTRNQPSCVKNYKNIFTEIFLGDIFSDNHTEMPHIQNDNILTLVTTLTHSWSGPGSDPGPDQECDGTHPRQLNGSSGSCHCPPARPVTWVWFYFILIADIH